MIKRMTSADYRQGGKQLIIYASIAESRFGRYLVASTAKGVCNLFFFDRNSAGAYRSLRALWPNTRIMKKRTAAHRLVEKFFEKSLSGRRKISLHLNGTPFQLKVWRALLKISKGSLVSYSRVAALVQKPFALRAVGTAVGRNPIGYLIPCHRVIKVNGRIGEYRWGAERKKAIIKWEAC